jgi:hypothetical protein
MQQNRICAFCVEVVLVISCMFDARGHRFHEDAHNSAGAASAAAAALQFSSVCEEQVVRL